MIDPLSQVLGSVRLTGGVFLEAHFTAPWCTEAHVTADDIRPFVEAPGEIIAYHFVVAGRMFCALEQGPPLEVAAGEVVLLPRNGVHTLGSAAGPAANSGRRTHPDGRERTGAHRLRRRRRAGPCGLRLPGHGGNPQSADRNAAGDAQARHRQGHIARLGRSLGPLCRAASWRPASSAPRTSCRDCPSCCSSRRYATTHRPPRAKMQAGWAG